MNCRPHMKSLLLLVAVVSSALALAFSGSAAADSAPTGWTWDDTPPVNTTNGWTWDDGNALNRPAGWTWDD